VERGEGRGERERGEGEGEGVGESKVVDLKFWGITTLRMETRPKLIKMKLGINCAGIS
jgi:hypothetical protein